MAFNECQQLLHITTRAEADAMKSQMFDHHGRNRNRGSRMIHNADQSNLSSPRCCLNGSRDGVPSEDIEDMVGTPAIGEPEYDLIPCSIRTGIDDFCGSQLFQARNLGG